MERDAAGEEHDDRNAYHDRRQRDRRAETALFRSGGHHFGRRRFARGERGGERVAAGQRRRHL